MYKRQHRHLAPLTRLKESVQCPRRVWFTFSGYFQLVSLRTKLGVAYGTETTPGGRPRVDQDTDGSRLYFY